MVLEPRVFIAVPTGPPKRYALSYMFAALENLDWDNREVHFAVTRYKGGYRSEEGFPEKIQRLVEASDIGEISIHWVPLNEEQFKEPWRAILTNLQLLRGLFLDGDCEYFLLLGGDNPPPRETIKRLMNLDVDVACGLLYQRHGGGAIGQPVPMVYYPSWMLRELPKDLPLPIYEEFEKTWIQNMFYIPIYCDPNWKRKKKLTEFVGGSGCTLIRRKVLENVGFNLPNRFYHSEDIHFFAKCMYYDYSICCDLKFHVPHLHEDGSAW